MPHRIQLCQLLTISVTVWDIQVPMVKKGGGPINEAPRYSYL